MALTTISDIEEATFRLETRNTIFSGWWSIFLMWQSWDELGFGAAVNFWNMMWHLNLNLWLIGDGVVVGEFDIWHEAA